MSEFNPHSLVKFWWPTRVLQRRYPDPDKIAAVLSALAPDRDIPAGVIAGTNAAMPAFVDWLQQAASDLINANQARGAKPVTLKLVVRAIEVGKSGQVPRRAKAALVAGVYCIDPGTIDATVPEGACLTFLDPRAGAEMIPGTSAPTQADRALRLAAGRLILFPGWLAQGYTAPPGPDAPRWIAVRFHPVITA